MTAIVICLSIAVAFMSMVLGTVVVVLLRERRGDDLIDLILKVEDRRTIREKNLPIGSHAQVVAKMDSAVDASRARRAARAPVEVVSGPQTPTGNGTHQQIDLNDLLAETDQRARVGSGKTTRPPED